MNKTYLYIGIIVVVIIIGFLLVQNANRKADAAIAAANAPKNNYSGGPAWLQVLNSPAVASFLGGFGSGVGSSSGQGKA